jgi:hypothetical protein
MLSHIEYINDPNYVLPGFSSLVATKIDNPTN